MKIKKLIGSVILVCMICCCFAFTANPVQNQEYNLKAAFLYRFLEYVEWDHREQSGDVNIIVLGDSEIVRPLVLLTRDKRVDNRRVRIRQYFSPSEIAECHILFISKKYKLPVESVLSRLSDQKTLVISESDVDFELGTHINFMIFDNKLKFAVNLRSTSRSGLKISSQLLQHAVIIKR